MPLSFDFPLSSLHTYQGSSPCPRDFDRYWELALEELASTHPDPVWTENRAISHSFARCYTLTFTGVGGARVHARVVLPTGSDRPTAAAIQFHGYARRTYDWAEGLKLSLAASGVAYAGLDCRGQGGLSEDTGCVSGNTLKGHLVRGLTDAVNGRPEKLFYRAQYMDAVRLVQLIGEHDAVDGDRISTFGRSQGGALALVAAALEPRVAQCLPTFPFLSDFKRAYDMDVAGADGPYGEISDWFRRFDPLHELEVQVFEALGYIDIQNFAPRISAPVEWSIGLMDKICPPSTQFAAYNKLRGDKTMLVYPDFGHEAFDHGEDRLLQRLTSL